MKTYSTIIYILVWMMIIPKSYCYFDTELVMLVKRMEDLERRDDEKSAIIENLTKKLLDQEGKVQDMGDDIDKLKHENAALSKENLKMDRIIRNLQENQNNLRDAVEIFTSQERLQDKELKRENTKPAHSSQIDTNPKQSVENQQYMIFNSLTSNESNGQKTTSLDVENYPKGTQQNSVKDQHLYSGMRRASVKVHNEYIHTNENNTRHMNQVRTNDHANQARRFVANVEGPVAFHAVSDKGLIQHLGTNENIKFETTLLNLGAGYHNQHGVFIAPKAGLYLFSVSILSSHVTGQTEFRADMDKNGVALARIFGHGDSDRHDQGSVTVVTQMNLGDELWIRHVFPTNGELYGGRYTSFTGLWISDV